MSEKLQNKHPIYPIIGLVLQIGILVIGLLNAGKISCLIFLGAVYFLFMIFGYYKACLATLPLIIVFGAIFCGITYGISKNLDLMWASLARVMAFCISVIPGLGLSPAILTRCLTQIKVPRMLTLGMMICLSFFPLLALEISHIREAMKTRGAGSVWNIKVFYRAFLIPLVMRLVNISDSLSLSVETRGFTTSKQAKVSIYKPVKIHFYDIIITLLIVGGATLTFFL